MNLGIDMENVREEVKRFIGQSNANVEGPAGDLPITPRAKKVFNLAFDEARLQGVNYVGTEHLLLAVLREEEGVSSQVLLSMGVKLEDLREQVVLLLGGEVPGTAMNQDAYQEPPGVQPNPGQKGRKTRSKTPTLDNFSRDLTRDAQEGRVDPVIGRESEIERVVQILSRRTKNNPVLIGDPGVGKTAIVEGLAQRIFENKVPETLSHKRVVSLDLSSMIAGTKYRGEFEDRLTKIVNEIKNAGDVVILSTSCTPLWGREPPKALLMPPIFSSLRWPGENSSA
jgi:ATP-dependent Clp protease ATP-binding subunit ClpC